MSLPYQSQSVAGQILGQCLAVGSDWNDPLVLALPRGGVVVGAEVARSLGAELDVMSVHLVESAKQSELILGAVTTGEFTQRNESMIEILGVPEEEFRERRDRVVRELRRLELLYRGSRPRPLISGRSVLLVDDALRDAAKLKAAVRVLQREDPIEIVVAAPVGSASAVATLWREADSVVCPATPDPFFPTGLFYRVYRGVTDVEVAATLHEAWGRTQLLKTMVEVHARLRVR